MSPGADLEAGLVPLARILATVDLERALGALGRPPGDATTALADPHLGAAVVVIAADTSGDRDGLAVAVAEPTTEGRLTATLARHDEGEVGAYATAPDDDGLDGFRRRAAAAGIALSRVESGPFGRSVLVLNRPVTGPHLIVVERRTLPSRP